MRLPANVAMDEAMGYVRSSCRHVHRVPKSVVDLMITMSRAIGGLTPAPLVRYTTHVDRDTKGAA